MDEEKVLIYIPRCKVCEAEQRFSYISRWVDPKQAVIVCTNCNNESVYLIQEEVL